MKVVRPSEVPKQPVDSPLFTGPDVSRQPLAPDSTDYNLSIVNFGKGVKNKFHKHESDQVLIATAGKGIVATEHEEHTMEVGDVALIPAGEKHWHGSIEGSEFSHISLQRAGSTTTQLED